MSFQDPSSQNSPIKMLRFFKQICVTLKNIINIKSKKICLFPQTLCKYVDQAHQQNQKMLSLGRTSHVNVLMLASTDKLILQLNVHFLSG